MDAVARFVGEMLAHAVYSVCDGATLVPILAGQSSSGIKELQRVLLDDIGDSAEYARQHLDARIGVHGVAIWDGYVRNVDSTAKVDALFAEVAQFRSGETVLAEPARYTLVVRYRHAHDPEGFGVFPVRELSAFGLQRMSGGVETAFWYGVDDHTEGAKVWRDSEIHREPWP